MGQRDSINTTCRPHRLRNSRGLERLSKETLAFERVITGLRDLENGVDLGDDLHRFIAAIEHEVSRGYLIADGSHIRLTEQGLRFMNDVLLSFA